MLRRTFFGYSVLLAACSTMFLSSCGGESNKEKDETTEHETVNEVPRGDESVLRLAIPSDHEKLNPKFIRSLVGANLAFQVYEGLVKLNPKTLEVEPALATWEVSGDGKTYTFTLREDAVFQDNPIFAGGKGRPVTAEDVVATYNYYCQPEEERENSAYNTGFKGVVLGADACYMGKAQTVDGISALGNKVIIKLVQPNLSFLQKIASVPGLVLAQEAIEAGPGDHVVGSGPFNYVGGKEQGKALFAKNANYYLKNDKGQQLPLLDSLVVTVINEKNEQLELFEAGKLHFIDGLPRNRVSDYVESNIDKFSTGVYKLKQENDMAVQYYEFNLTRPHLQDVRVRKAINLAINRSKIITKILNNQANCEGHYGITPPLRQEFKGYDFDGIAENGYSFDPEKARELMAEAGYVNGEGFPALELEYNQDNIHAAVAEEISLQLKQNLGINVKMEMVTFEEKMEDAAYARKDMIRSAWVADYPSPESFLINGYGKLVPNSLRSPSDLNSMRYVNPEFDRLFEAGVSAKSKEEQYKYFSDAEKIFINDAPIIPLWYQMDFKVMDGRVKNFHVNAIDRWDFTEVTVQAIPAS